MKKVVLYYGPKSNFITQLPNDTPITTISELAIYSDKKMREHLFKIQSRHSDTSDLEPEKKKIPCLVAFSDQYAAISESAIQGFLSFVDQYDVDDVYLQNPPTQMVSQFYKLQVPIDVLMYRYNSVDHDILREINATYSDHIIGQEKVLHQLLISLYPLCKNDFKKPVVMLFYGPTGVGKTETALFLSSVMQQQLFRKQLSMFHSDEFAAYLFGGRHSQTCFAKDLMERESNVILLDEFDKPNPVFHSAFYQLFDDGIYEDKNYRADLRKAVIICTSNYTSDEEAKEKLGAPLFARFDAVIRFDQLSKDTIEKILDKEYQTIIDGLDQEESERISPRDIKTVLHAHLAKLDNVRQIKRLVRDVVSDELLASILQSK